MWALVLDAAGDIYGVTDDDGELGIGTVFELVAPVARAVFRRRHCGTSTERTEALRAAAWLWTAPVTSTVRLWRPSVSRRFYLRSGVRHYALSPLVPIGSQYRHL